MIENKLDLAEKELHQARKETKYSLDISMLEGSSWRPRIRR
jgi:hypothetical protein